MNDVLSMGLHRCWKRRLISILGPRPGMRMLDVAGGTGDIAFKFLLEYQKKFPKNAANSPQVTIVDINPAMLEVGRKRAAQSLPVDLLPSIEWRCGDAEQLTQSISQGPCVAAEAFDAYSIAFGIRNCTSIEKVLVEAHRTLVPGGLFAVLEFSPHLEENGGIMSTIGQQAYDLYSAYGIPALGALIGGHREPYQYLVESIRKFPTNEAFAEMIKAVGFSHVHVESLACGICAIHTAVKL